MCRVVMERKKGLVVDEGSVSCGGDDYGRQIGGQQQQQQPTPQKKKQQQQHELLLGVKLRRGIVSKGRRGGTSTPAPFWKVVDEEDNFDNQEKITSSLSTSSATAAAPTISARKLGASLWETEDMFPVSRVSRRDDYWTRQRNKSVKDSDLDDFYSLGKHDRPQGSGADHQLASGRLAHHHKSIGRNGHGLELATPSDCSSVEASTPSGSFDQRRRNYGQQGHYIKTSTDLINVLNRIWSLEEQHASNMSMMRALKLDLHYAHEQIHKLVEEHQLDRREIDDLLKYLTEQKILWKNKERKTVNVVIQSLKDDAEDERRLRKHSENLHRKLAKDLYEMKSLYSKASKELEKERKMRNLLEDLLDEFAKGIGDYDVEVRELKQKSNQYSVHRCDRLLLHISEAWLDERLQMKLAEDRGDSTEVSTVLDRLGCDITRFLNAKRNNFFADGNLTQEDDTKNLVLRRRSLESVHFNGATSAPQDGEDGDSIVSDLHCFDLITRNDVSSPANFEPDLCKFQDHLETRRSNRGKKKVVNSAGNLLTGEQSKRTSSSSVNKVHEICLHHQDGKEDAYHSDISGSKEDGQSNVTANHLNEKSKRQTDFRNLCRALPEDHDGEDKGGRFSYSQSGTVSYDVRSAFSVDPADIGTAESSLKTGSELNRNTLKSKLLEARLEGKHARLRTSRA